MKPLLLKLSLAGSLFLAAILLSSCESDPYYGGPGNGYGGQPSGYYSSGPYYAPSPYYGQGGGSYAYRNRPDYYGNSGPPRGYGYPVQPHRSNGNYSYRSSDYDRPPPQQQINHPREQNNQQGAPRSGGGRPPVAAPGPVSSKNQKLEAKREEERRKKNR